MCGALLCFHHAIVYRVEGIRILRRVILVPMSRCICAQAGTRSQGYSDGTRADDEFTTQGGVVIEVDAVNQPPSIPIQLTPENGGIVRVENAPLVVENSTDLDGDPLVYEFELHYGEPDDAPDQVGNVSEDVSGQTTWTTDPIENRLSASWRVRAYDGAAENAYSPWTDYWTDACQVEYSLGICVQHFVADSLTDVNGRTTFSGRISAGGCIPEGGIYIACQGYTIFDEAQVEPICLDVVIVSPDINADSFVNLSDLSFFGESYNKQVGDSGYDTCCDFNDDGWCNLSDFSFMGEHYQHQCF